MNDVEKVSNQMINEESGLTVITEAILQDTRTDLSKVNSLSVPIGELSALGAAVSSLLPAFRTITQSTTFASDGLYRVANAAIGDTLKIAKNGNFWGAMKTPGGTSKFAQLQQVGSISSSSTTVMPINPVLILMAVALHSVEKQLGNIADMEKQILGFLETEKQSEIEADVETLSGMITKYKINWDNEHYVASNYKLALDIQRTARKNMLFYRKNVTENLHSKKLIVGQSTINSSLNSMVKMFKYFRLSLYSYSLASLLEILLSGNFKEEYITGAVKEVETMTDEYRTLFEQTSSYLERMGKTSVETNLLKGVGTATNAMGRLIGSIPKVKDGRVDEYLQERGEKIKRSAENLEKDAVASFSKIGNPNTAGLVNNMKEINRIYNHTEAICFDNTNIYLITD